MVNDRVDPSHGESPSRIARSEELSRSRLETKATWEEIRLWVGRRSSTNWLPRWSARLSRAVSYSLRTTASDSAHVARSRSSWWASCSRPSRVDSSAPFPPPWKRPRCEWSPPNLLRTSRRRTSLRPTWSRRGIPNTSTGGKRRRLAWGPRVRRAPGQSNATRRRRLWELGWVPKGPASSSSHLALPRAGIGMPGGSGPQQT